MNIDLPGRIVTGAQLIANERERQLLKEGYDAGHDDKHIANEILSAAYCYIKYELAHGKYHPLDVYACDWPFEYGSWKPKDTISNLVRAGALIAAEIDRLRRARKQEQPEGEYPSGPDQEGC